MAMRRCNLMIHLWPTVDCFCACFSHYSHLAYSSLTEINRSDATKQCRKTKQLNKINASRTKFTGDVWNREMPSFDGEWIKSEIDCNVYIVLERARTRNVVRIHAKEQKTYTCIHTHKDAPASETLKSSKWRKRRRKKNEPEELTSSHQKRDNGERRTKNGRQ